MDRVVDTFNESDKVSSFRYYEFCFGGKSKAKRIEFSPLRDSAEQMGLCSFHPHLQPPLLSQFVNPTHKPYLYLQLILHISIEIYTNFVIEIPNI